MITVYLSNVSGMSIRDIKEAAKNHPDHTLKSEAMSIIEELIEEGRAQGIAEGLSQGLAQVAPVLKLWLNGMSIPAIAQKLDLPIVNVQKIIDCYESDN